MKLRPFELTLVVIFIVMIFLSLLLLSSYKAKNDNDGQPVVGSVTIWGTLPKEGMTRALQDIAESNESYRDVKYVEVASDTFDADLINAIADQNGPDLVLLPHEKLVPLRTKIKPISYESYALRDIKSTYIDGAMVFALSDGLYAYPIMVDPLMMYFNKNKLSNKNYLDAPKTWEALVNEYLPNLIERNPDRTIVRSVVAMGEYPNVQNAFGILSMLLLQAGSEGVQNTENRSYEIRLNQSPDRRSKPFEIATDFYTRFSKPSNALYSWNRSFSSDKDRFLSEDLIFYFGYGSEARGLEKQNPNLSFDIAEVPQGAAATVRRTYGTFYGLAALQSSNNLAGAAVVMRDLAGQPSERIAALYEMVPATRSAVSKGSNDTYGRLAYTSAGIAYGWLSPSLEKVDGIFTTLTQDVNENRKDIPAAVNDALGRLELEY